MATMLPFPLEVPEVVARQVTGADWRTVNAGRTRAEVYAFDNGLFLKVLERDDADVVFGQLQDEFLRLQALGTLVPVPRVAAFIRGARHDYLLTTELGGRDVGAMLADNQMVDGISALAAGCRLLHGAERAGFPFVDTVEALLQQARERVELGLVDASDFDEARAGRSARDLLDELCSLASPDSAPVLTHGDLCPPNLIARGRRPVGFVDVGRAAIADRWRDLALCLRSIEAECGERGCTDFLRQYGAERDERRLAFYTLLDEFF